jgi:1,4-dihydroxy-2-naphthoate octaprenyltransferase
MPQSRKRHGHHYQKPSDIPASQRTKGRIIWAILFAVFGLVLTFFAAGDNWIVLIIGAVIAGFIGYTIGKNMEQAA